LVELRSLEYCSVDFLDLAAVELEALDVGAVELEALDLGAVELEADMLAEDEDLEQLSERIHLLEKSSP